jgi:hypothetical protein
MFSARAAPYGARRGSSSSSDLARSVSVVTLKDVESLMRLREPAVWVALGALVLNLVLAIVAMATYPGRLADIGLTLSAEAANPVPLIALAVLVSFCVLRERTAHARLLTLVSLITGALAVLFGVGLALLGLAAEPTPVLGVLAAIVTQAISIIAVVLLVKLYQLQAVPRRLPAGIGLPPYQESLPAPLPDQRLQPTWQPDAAAGAAWRTAGEAAAGAPAAAWGGDATPAAWQPIPTQSSGPRPQGDVSDDPALRPNGQPEAQPPLDWWGRPLS